MTAAAPALGARNPFPGLRPFRPDEEHVFFGRERQVDRMIDTLAARRFLAVVGSSGSGKSSLVNCGLRPALHRGGMAVAGAAWRMAQFRPGGDPIGHLARALGEPGVLYDAPLTGPLSADALIEATLRLGSLGLVDMVGRSDVPADTRLLVVVDQFEELFRFRSARATGRGTFDPSDDAIAFVRLLLRAASAGDGRIYVLLTMRSDFLGDCAQFEGLPEAINEGEYLVPRLTRNEIRSAIVGPVRVAGGEISPVLVTQLLNDVGDNFDQLPILQHALHRTWARWELDGATMGPIDLPHYEASGGMARALDRHAEEAYRELGTVTRQRIGERIFKALTDKATDPRGIRRPTSLAALTAITGAPPSEVEAVVDVFRHPSRSFLVPPLPERLEPGSVVDISHESLMRVWTRLDRWADEEVQSTRMYRRLSEAAELYALGQTNVWRDPDLRLALDWRRRNEPTAAWAEQHYGGFDRAMAFLDRSRDAQQAARIEADIERRWLAGWSYVPLAFATLLFLVLQPYVASWRWPFSIVLNLAADVGDRWRDWLLNASWIPPILAGTPAAVAYLLLTPYARRLFGRAALARIERAALDGSEWVDPGERPSEPDAVDVHRTVYAGFWRRALASLLDWVIGLATVLGVAYVLFELLVGRVEDRAIVIAVVLTALLVFLVYDVMAWTSRHLATPGMRLAGIFVADVRGRRLGRLRATARHFARFLSYYTAGLGFFIQPWDERRQALHDRLSGTVVLRGRPSLEGRARESLRGRSRPPASGTL